jgi:hypothetical protein
MSSKDVLTYLLTTTRPPETVTLASLSGAGAGGFTTDPSSMEYLLPWHWQLIVPPVTEVTGHC